MRKLILPLYVFLLSACGSSGSSFELLYPGDLPQATFAVAEIRAALAQVSEAENVFINLVLNQDGKEQSYQIIRDRKEIRIQGSDASGLMYGGLELAELIRMEGGLPDLKEPVYGEPFMKKRGLKFNIPLDIRTPSYQDAGDAAQHNIAEMWNFEFWEAYLDMMARNRYNVLTLWNPHPFPSMIRLDSYPDIALEDVCGTSFPLDTDRPDEPVAKFIAGCGVSQEVLDHLVVLKKMTMEEKIAFWRRVMSHARDRGIDVFFITWNIKLNCVAPPGWYREQDLKMGERGKYGINNDQENPRTIAYLREAVKEFLLTYPDVAGIGITAGENMEDRQDEFDREKWLWATYGAGVLDAKAEQPGREIQFIHRFWMSGIDKIKEDFIDKYPDPIALSYKYARARMYASTAPTWADEYIAEIRKAGLRSWWNIRNDDIFHFRWGDAEYASEFMKNMPQEEVSAGYFMGSDGYVWGREFISKHPMNPRELEIDKHWYNFMLWGRMGYNPELGHDRLLAMLEGRYPGIDPESLFQTWATASRIPSQVTRFHWHSWDYQWAVEGCLDLRKGFHTVEDFIHNPVMEGSGFLTIPDYITAMKRGAVTQGRTPVQVANSLDSLSAEVLESLVQLEQHEGQVNTSFDELLYDLRAWAWMGNYYAWKIRGATALYAFRKHMGSSYGLEAQAAMEQALQAWKNYAGAASRNYHPQFLAKTRTVDWQALTEHVKKDLEWIKLSVK